MDGDEDQLKLLTTTFNCVGLWKKKTNYFNFFLFAMVVYQW